MQDTQLSAQSGRPQEVDMAVASSNRKEAVINVRLASQTRELIDSAAAAMGKSRSEFIIESARQSAMNVLLDQRFFVLDPKSYDAFVAILDHLPAPNKKLKALFARKAPWEK
jgi:uncharacterized protein (DUF1778 family)